jgi:hypothetical protein
MTFLKMEPVFLSQCLQPYLDLQHNSDDQLLQNFHNELSLPKMNFHFRFILGQPDCATRRKRFL